ncbi:predicted protein [Botrytis cinerea T4]|uniref:Uncharacterized protein n=1 Tax=Botryotinia fuckeliana (strain T4) TaxID=999810 RepID=G2YLX9_BOTF4|nr:predicted protein [Botrytis cinerea T4]
MSQSTRPAESIEDSKFGAAQEKSSGEGIRVEANVKSHTIEKDTLTLITFTRWLRFSKLCGNEACRRPSHFIEEDLETVASPLSKMHETFDDLDKQRKVLFVLGRICDEAGFRREEGYIVEIVTST